MHGPKPSDLCPFKGGNREKEKQPIIRSAAFYGAGDEARTRYLHLGKVALYQMSYTRISAEHWLL